MMQYFTLIIGTLLWAGSNGNHALATAPWLSLTLLLIFFHSAQRRDFVLGYCLFAVALGVSWRGVIPFSGVPYWGTILGLGFIIFLPFIIDVKLGSTRNGLSRTLVFPLAWTAVEFIYTTFSPLGSNGSLAYTQAANGALLQLLTVTGITGVTFMLTWGSSVAATLWLDRFERAAIRATAVYGVIILAVLLLGDMRLSFQVQSAPTVKISAIVAHDNRSLVGGYLKGQIPRTAMLQHAAEVLDLYIDATVREAEAGSKIIVWPELGLPIGKENEPLALARLAKTAKGKGIYLVVPFYTLPEQGGRNENKAMVFDPSGQTVLEHWKYGGNLVEDDRIPGQPRIDVLDTPYGRLGIVICWDADLYAIIRQAGKVGVDILIDPAMDWREVTPYHSIVASYRAIENGFSLVKPTDNGLSVVVDPLGRKLASFDHFQTQSGSMVAYVSSRGNPTLYPWMGDWAGWLSIVGLTYLIASIVWNRRPSIVHRHA